MRKQGMRKWMLLSFLTMTPVIGFAGESAGQRYQRAYVTETTDRDIEAALTLYQSIVDDPAAPAIVRAEAYYRIGLCHERLGNNDAATDAYQSAVATEPNQSQAYLAEARAAIERLDARRDVTRVLMRGQKFFTPVHQLLLASVGGLLRPDGGKGLGIELFGYEYIHPSGFALKISPLNLSGVDMGDSPSTLDMSVDWAPVWVRRYLTPETSKVQPFVGLGFVRSDRTRLKRELAYYDPFYGFEIYRYYQEEKTTNGLGLEFGLALGDVGRRSSRIIAKILPVGLSREETVYQFSYEFLLGFRSK